jgi:hypothetical protein
VVADSQSCLSKADLIFSFFASKQLRARPRQCAASKRFDAVCLISGRLRANGYTTANEQVVHRVNVIHSLDAYGR